MGLCLQRPLWPTPQRKLTRAAGAAAPSLPAPSNTAADLASRSRQVWVLAVLAWRQLGGVPTKKAANLAAYAMSW